MNYARTVDAFLYEHLDVLYLAFLFFSLIVFGIILARQKPRPPLLPHFTIIILPPPAPPFPPPPPTARSAWRDLPPVLEAPPRLAPREHDAPPVRPI